MKGIRIEKQRVTLSLFIGGKVIYTENPVESTKNY